MPSLFWITGKVTGQGMAAWRPPPKKHKQRRSAGTARTSALCATSSARPKKNARHLQAHKAKSDRLPQAKQQE
jgi:hypothetical protein